MRADLAHELDDVELIARDGRVRELAEAADLGDDVAQLVEVLDGLAHGGVGDVDAEALFQLVDDLELELGLVVVEGGLVALHRRVDDGDEELVVLDGVYEEEMLLHPLHGGAALGAEEGAEVVVAALDAALEDGADVGTVAVRHVVSGDVRGGTTRRAQARGKAPGKIQQDFGDIIAVIPQRDLAIVDRLRDQLVLSLLQEVFEVDQVFQILQFAAPLIFICQVLKLICTTNPPLCVKIIVHIDGLVKHLSSTTFKNQLVCKRPGPGDKKTPPPIGAAAWVLRFTRRSRRGGGVCVRRRRACALSWRGRRGRPRRRGLPCRCPRS